MVISIEEDQKTLEYQETMNADVGNIPNKKIWIPIYKVIDNLFFAAKKLFPTGFLDQCKNNPNKTQNLPSKVNASLRKWLWNKGYMHK